jgi:hypothetical protein
MKDARVARLSLLPPWTSSTDSQITTQLINVLERGWPLDMRARKKSCLNDMRTELGGYPLTVSFFIDVGLAPLSLSLLRVMTLPAHMGNGVTRILIIFRGRLPMNDKCFPCCNFSTLDPRKI